MQWTAIQDAVGHLFAQVKDALTGFFSHVLKELPKDPAKLNPSYLDDNSYAPKMFQHGTFADQPDDFIKVSEKAPNWALNTAAINALWGADKVFIMKLSDKAYGMGAGAACKSVFSPMGVCRDGVLHIWMRWSFAGPLASESVFLSATLSHTSFFVWGAYDFGSAQTKLTSTTKNAESLKAYDLTLDELTTSALEVFAAHGFPFTNQNGAILDNLRKEPLNLDKSRLIQMTVPVCDLEVALGGHSLKKSPGQYDEKELEGNRVTWWGACTCAFDPKWPNKVDQFKQPTGSYSADECQKSGWTK